MCLRAAAWRGPELEGCQILELVITCDISIYLSNCSGCTRNFGYIWSRTDLLAMLFLCWNLWRNTWLHCEISLICWNRRTWRNIVKGLQSRYCSTEKCSNRLPRTVAARWAYSVHIVCQEPCNLACNQTKQLRIWIRIWSQSPAFVLFPNVDVMLRIYLTLMVTNCNGERSFSTVSRVKSQIRTSMSDDCLNVLSLLCIDSDVMRIDLGEK